MENGTIGSKWIAAKIMERNVAKACGQCQQQPKAAHIDLAAYNSLESAADIADLLKVDRIQQV
ncbi:MAG: hypothetical protein IPP67_00010 [Rhodospirillaceae bacterium]|nr:hypothetical protein [Rhodospirillaceae bacterium]